MTIQLIDELIKVCMVLLVVLTALVISRRNLISLINTYALHSLVLSAIAFLFFLGEGANVFLYASILTIITKLWLIPALLKRTQKIMKIYTDLEYHYLHPTSSIFLSLFIVIIVFLAFSGIKDDLGLDPFNYFGVVMGFSLVLIGFMIIFSRIKIITKTIGYLVMENGVVLLSFFVGEMPFLIEVMVLMDLLALVAITSILGFGMNSSIEEFHKRLNPFRNWFKKVDEK
ncbi:TPA: hydrogenase subunit [Candidatus Woesearchaeota archaeon]|nr:hydrogenase subunit [Candidatus Woesearchaeota archaeon]HII68312.1 hydrogenase subunit [Candidatus Woesearchaeota archaeon]